MSHALRGHKRSIAPVGSPSWLNSLARERRAACFLSPAGGVLQAIAAGTGWSLELHPPRRVRAAEIGERHHGCIRTTIHERAGGSRSPASLSFYKETGAADGCAVTGEPPDAGANQVGGGGGGETSGQVPGWPSLLLEGALSKATLAHPCCSRQRRGHGQRNRAQSSAAQLVASTSGSSRGPQRDSVAAQAAPPSPSPATPRRPHVLSSPPSRRPAPSCSAGVALTAHTRRRSQRDPHAATARQSTPACVCALEGAQVTVHPLGLCARWTQCRSRCRAAAARCSACAQGGGRGECGGEAGRGVVY